MPAIRRGRGTARNKRKRDMRAGEKRHDQSSPTKRGSRSSRKRARPGGGRSFAALGMTTPSTARIAIPRFTRDDSLSGFFRGSTGASNLIHPDPARVEPPGRGDHLVDGLVEVRRRLPLEPQRVDARDHECLEVRALEPALLEARDGRVHRFVELQQLVRALATRLHRLGKLGAEELVAPLEYGVERAARKA